MEANQIINKIKQGKFTKKEIIKIAESCMHAINDGNHDLKH